MYHECTMVIRSESFMITGAKWRISSFPDDYKLHCRGYVFGDLRVQHVLFDEDSKVKFIDFDWSGHFDMNVRDESLPADFQKRIDDEKTNVKSVTHYALCVLPFKSVVKHPLGAGCTGS